MTRRSQFMSGARKAVSRVKPMTRSVVKGATRRYGAPLIGRGISKGIKNIKNKL